MPLYQPTLSGLQFLLPGTGCLFVALVFAFLVHYRRKIRLLYLGCAALGMGGWLIERSLRGDLVGAEVPWSALDHVANVLLWVAAACWALAWLLYRPGQLDPAVLGWVRPPPVPFPLWHLGAIFGAGGAGLLFHTLLPTPVSDRLLELVRGCVLFWSTGVLVYRGRKVFRAVDVFLAGILGLLGLLEALRPAVAPGPGSTLYAGLVLTAIVCLLGLVLGEEQRDLRQAVTRLAESEDRFRLIFEHSGVGMALLSPEGRILTTNPALETMLGYDAPELKGRRLGDFVYHQDITVENLPVRRTSGSGDESSLMYEREKRYIHRDGHAIWARVLRVPVKGVTGEVRYHVGVLIDITQRKRAEEELSATTQQLRMLNQAAAEGIFVTDELSRFLDVNPALCQSLGYEREELLGQRLLELAGDRQALARYHHSVLQGQARVRVETQLRGKQGQVVEVELSGGLVQMGDRALLHGICRDVTERKKAEAALREARKMESLAALVGGIAHDFNNQLTAVLGNLALARGDLDRMQQADVLESLSDAEKAARRCADITQRLLTFSRGRVGSLQTVDVGPLVSQGISQVQRHVPPSVRVELHQEPELWPLAADPSQVQQVLVNLLTNACEAMPQGGRLTVCAGNRELTRPDCASHVEARPGRFVVLSVRDTGIGIAPELRNHLFEPFFTTKPGGQAAGMGLAMTYGIVKAHKGWIEVDSEPGQGSIFTVFLPTAEMTPTNGERPPPDRQTTPLGEEQRASGQRSRCILVVDDEDLIRTLARITLERRGFRVLTAQDGEEAVSVYRQFARQIDLVLLDYVMPRLTGLQVFRILKEIDPDVCVVFSSGYTLDQDSDHLLASGARAFLPKPYHPDDLIRTIREVLS